jgi:hypothetical protein
MRAREMGMTSHSNNFNTRLQIAGAINIVFQVSDGLSILIKLTKAGTEKRISSRMAHLIRA